MQLVIVESPTKARKLSTYLGKGYEVEASVGHVRDLPKSGFGVDLENNFEPTYEVSKDKKKVITKLKSLAEKADTIYLATDPDREGEAIAWHIKEILSENGIKKTFKRATFHEITKSAVMAAMEKPGSINQNLVDAQQARRIVDRLVGYSLSPVLWRKVRRGLSAGRVQSVALRLIAEREREIEAFKPDEYWELDVELSPQEKGGENFIARVVEVESKKYEPTSKSDVDPVVNALEAATYTILDVEKKQRRRSSLPPFITSTLQQTAATRLGYTGRQTMRLAQQLYEEGLITYHRTDATSLSTQALDMARAHISSQFGEKYLPAKPNFFANRSKNAQEAHEAIRITDTTISQEQIEAVSGTMTERHAKLYDLIYRRFVASQMTPALYDQTKIMISYAAPTVAAAKTGQLKANGSILTFDGWMKLFDRGDDQLLPDISEKQVVFKQSIAPEQKFTQPPARFNDASLIKELEKRGIGRPSTYASIISVIVDRGYIERLQRKFFATATGLTVSDFLKEHFETIMDYDFTAQMEEDLDKISLGKKEWQSIVKTFFGPFSKKVEAVTDKADRVQIPVEKTGESCPTCGEKEKGEVVIRSGRYGNFRSCSRFPDCDFSENFSEKLPDQNCPLCGRGEIAIKKSRWGKPFYGCSTYPTCDWASWKKPEKDLKVTQKEWDLQKKEREERKKARAAAKAESEAAQSKSSKTKKSPKKKTTKKKAAPKKKSSRTKTSGKKK